MTRVWRHMLGPCFALTVASTPLWAQNGTDRTSSNDSDAPLSAIEWLSESVVQPDVITVPTVPVQRDEPRPGTQARREPPANEHPVTQSALSPHVSVRPLGAPAARAVGVLPPALTGLSTDLWSNSDAETLAALLLAQDSETLPALQRLIVTLALAEANPPQTSITPERFLVARIDRLLAMGALEPALALLENAKPDHDILFQRWFDVALLTGTEDAACRALASMPDVAPSPAARVFCLARLGDWSAAALTLNTGRALGDIEPQNGELLARFLDPELFEDAAQIPRPDPVTPLSFRMFEAIGEPLGTEGLPRAFLHSDLRPNLGWKAQLEAAERLTRAGAVAENRLVGLYTARVPAASGGVWERAKAVARMKTAIRSGDAAQIGTALNALWEEAGNVGLRASLARHFAPQLRHQQVPDAARNTLFKFLLLSDEIETAAARDDLTETDPFLTAVAQGAPDRAGPQTNPRRALVQTAFAASPDPDLVDMAQAGRSGEALLRTLAVLQQGVDGDAQAFARGMATLRALGHETTARQVALQWVILP